MRTQRSNLAMLLAFLGVMLCRVEAEWTTTTGVVLTDVTTLNYYTICGTNSSRGDDAATATNDNVLYSVYNAVEPSISSNEQALTIVK